MKIAVLLLVCVGAAATTPTAAVPIAVPTSGPTAAVPSTVPTSAPRLSASVFQTDLCAALVKSKCSKAVSSKNMLSVMKCAQEIFSDIINQPIAVSSITDAGCLVQMKGSIALLCTKDFEEQCEETNTYKHLKNCAHESKDDFTTGCQIAVENFKEKLEVAQKSLWKQDHTKHHLDDSEEEDELFVQEQDFEQDAQTEYQFLWGGDILSDPDPSKWRRIWHSYGKWVVGALGLLVLFLVLRCCKKRKAARRALRMRANEASELNGDAAAPLERNNCRWGRCSRNFWQSASAPFRADEMPSSAASYVEIPIARVAHPATPI